MVKDIEYLIEKTTIIRVDNNKTREIVFGEEGYISCFQQNQKKQIDKQMLEDFWERKWNSFEGKWAKERQNYRFMYETFNFFYLSFSQFLNYKMISINESENSNITNNDLIAGIYLNSIYHHGKKCIDIMKELELLEGHAQNGFIEKFRETRNKIIEHNFNPKKLEIQIDPFTRSLSNTDSLFKIGVHTDAVEENYTIYLDYFDYYKLEKIFTDVIRKF